MLFCPHHHRVIGCFVKAIHDRLWPTSQVRGLGRGTHVVGLRTGLGSGLAVDSLRGTRPWTAFVELGRKRREVAQSLQGGRGSYQCRYQSTIYIYIFLFLRGGCVNINTHIICFCWTEDSP